MFTVYTILTTTGNSILQDIAVYIHYGILKQ
jgi:hypothetical protein